MGDFDLAWDDPRPDDNYRPCNVVEQGCDAPPVDAFAKTGEDCFACGLPVCTNGRCSSMVEWYRFGKQRVCARCREEREREVRRIVKHPRR